MDIGVLSVVLILIYFHVCYAKETLRSVVTFFRHGQRTPVKFYLTDPYDDPKYWNGLGKGKLTEIGKQQLHYLGKDFRREYEYFIGKKYDANEIVVRSSATQRNLQSAKCFLRALYDTDDDIPVETVSLALVGNPLKNLQFNVHFLDFLTSNKKILQINSNNANLYTYLRKNTIYPVVIGLQTAFLIWDTLYSESQANLPLPEWTKDIWPEPMMQMARNYSRFFCSNRELQNIGVHGFMKLLVEHFQRVILGLGEPKIIIYSGHDLNILCYLNSFDYYKTNDPDIIKYASSITYELWQDEHDQYFIRTFFKPSIQDDRLPINVRSCDIDCSFKHFQKLLSPFTKK